MKPNGMKNSGYRLSAIRKASTVFAVSSLMVSGVQAANIDLTGLGYIQHGDALVYSMPVANYQFGYNTNNGPYAIDSTPGAIKVISANPYTKQAGRIKMSHLGRSGFRSSLDSTACMASLPRETPF